MAPAGAVVTAPMAAPEAVCSPGNCKAMLAGCALCEIDAFLQQVNLRAGRLPCAWAAKVFTSNAVHASGLLHAKACCNRLQCQLRLWRAGPDRCCSCRSWKQPVPIVGPVQELQCLQAQHKAGIGSPAPTGFGPHTAAVEAKLLHGAAQDNGTCQVQTLQA